MESKECQNCAMPMKKPEDYGIDKNGEYNEDYCCHCWSNGEFADWCKNITLDEMIENNIRFILGSEGAETEEKARSLSREYLSVLKRWKTT